MTLSGRALVSGTAEGPTMVLEEPLSFWGGVDPRTGLVIDPPPPAARGEPRRARVLVLPAGRGSSSSSSVLAEAIRAATAPVAIVLGEPDPILALGAIVARELYGTVMPIVALEPAAVPSGRRRPRALRIDGGAVDPL